METKFENPIHMFTENNDIIDFDDKERNKCSENSINVVTGKGFPNKVIFN